MNDNKEHLKRATDKLENIAYWMKKSKIYYDVKSLRSVFDDVISDYCDYKNSKSINK
jgi:radical SAM superfamily enzyme|tara:strand:- start:460 stop:630 length:171 start_codon:yes stop_codon:yes gene_type:complete